MGPSTATLLSGFGFAHGVNSSVICSSDIVTDPITNVTTVADTGRTIVETLSYLNATASNEPSGSPVPFNVSKWKSTATYSRAIPTTLFFTMTDSVPEGLTNFNVLGINSAGSITLSTHFIQSKSTSQPNIIRLPSSTSPEGLPTVELFFTTSVGRRLPVTVSMPTVPTKSSTFMTVASSTLPAVAKPFSTALTSIIDAPNGLSRNAKIGIGVGSALGAVLLVMLGVFAILIITSIILKGLIRNMGERIPHSTHDVDEEVAYRASVGTEDEASCQRTAGAGMTMPDDSQLKEKQDRSGQ